MGQEQSIHSSSSSSNCDHRHHHHHHHSTKSSHHRRDHTPASRHSSYSSDSKSSSISSTAPSTKGSISSGYNSDRSGSQVLPLYTNSHYKDINNNDIYRPLKLSKNKLNRLKILNADKDTAIYLEKHLSIKSYLEKDDENNKKIGPKLPEPLPKKSGIRNYTPKILCEKDPKKDIEHWI